MQDILEAARTATTADEFAAVMTTLELAIADAEQRRQASSDEAEGIIFEGGNLPKTRKAIADTTADLETLRVALKGARRRQGEAQKVEDEAQALRLIAQAEAIVDELRVASSEWFSAINASRAANAKLDEIRGRLRRVNEGLPEARRVDGRRVSSEARGVSPVFDRLSRDAMHIDEFLLTLATPGKRLRVEKPQAFPGAFAVGAVPSTSVTVT